MWRWRTVLPCHRLCKQVGVRAHPAILAGGRATPSRCPKRRPGACTLTPATARTGRCRTTMAALGASITASVRRAPMACGACMAVACGMDIRTQASPFRRQLTRSTRRRRAILGTTPCIRHRRGTPLLRAGVSKSRSTGISPDQCNALSWRGNRSRRMSPSCSRESLLEQNLP